MDGSELVEQLRDKIILHQWVTLKNKAADVIEAQAARLATAEALLRDIDRVCVLDGYVDLRRRIDAFLTLPPAPDSTGSAPGTGR